MNVSELDDMLAFVLNANDQQAATEYSASRRLMALNAAYRREWNEIQAHVSRNSKTAVHEFTWPAAQQTCEIPTVLRGKSILAFYDATQATSEPPRLILSYRDQNTLEWYDAGPGSAVTVRAQYVAAPNTLVGDQDSPDLILPQYHELLVWSAAIWLTQILDRETAPKLWNDMAQDLREQAIKGMSNRPLGDPTTIGPAYNDSGDSWE